MQNIHCVIQYPDNVTMSYFKISVLPFSYTAEELLNLNNQDMPTTLPIHYSILGNFGKFGQLSAIHQTKTIQTIHSPNFLPKSSSIHFCQTLSLPKFPTTQYTVHTALFKMATDTNLRDKFFRGDIYI